jgi:hypothetical protein
MIFKTSIDFALRLTQCVFNIEEPADVKNQMTEAGYKLVGKRLKSFMTRFGTANSVLIYHLFYSNDSYP